jgi:hypothetical protein
MKTLLAVATVGAALLTGGPVAAGDVYADAALLATIEGIDVIVKDDVEGGCLFNADGIKARLSAMLERSGIPVSDAGPWILYAYFIGAPTSIEGRRAGCMLGSTFQLTQRGPAKTWIVAGEGGNLTIGPDARDSSAMRNAETFADEVIAAILAARRSVGSSVPDARVSGLQS